MASLYLARLKGPEDFQKFLAIKVLHEHLCHEEQFVDMFLDEARIAAMIHHPNVVTIFDMGEQDGLFYIAMEYVHGQNLVELLKRAVKRPEILPWEVAVRIVTEAAYGLHAAHELKSATGKPLNVVHRDVSPSNILISYDGFVKVVDFGVAYAAERLAHTASGTLKGKVGYMSPEQTYGKPVDRRSDIFALGVVLFESLAKRRLFKRATEAATLLAIREDEVPSVHKLDPAVPQRLDEILSKALAKDPDERYPTAAAFAEDLEQVLLEEKKRVRSNDIADLMEEVFHDLKVVKERQIELASRQHSDAAALGTPQDSIAPDSGSLSVLQAEMSSIGLEKSRTPWMVAGFVGLLLLAAAGGFFLLGGGTHRSKTGTARISSRSAGGENASTARPARPAPPKRVTLRLQIQPADLPVKVQAAGRTFAAMGSADISLRRGSQAVPVVVTAEGYEVERFEVVPDRDKEVVLRLRKRAAPSSSTRTLGRRPATRPRHRPKARRPRKPRVKLMDLDM